MNTAYRHEIVSVVTRVPVASIETNLEAIVELYALDPEAERARDENPLTRLPGNTMIREFVGERLAFDERPYFLGYLDFDNFFVGIETEEHGVVHASEAIRFLQESFRENVLAFYDEAARVSGCIDATDRNGVSRSFPILTVSEGCLVLPRGGAKEFGEEVILRALAELKHQAKQSQERLAIRELSVTIV